MALTNFSWIIDGVLAGSDLPGNGSNAPRAVWSDCEYLHEQGVRVLVSLEHPGPSMSKVCEALGIEWLNFPVADFGVPVSDESFSRLVSTCVAACRSGLPVCIHCRAGIGRTGMVLACVYGRFADVDAATAIDHIRKKRTAIETRDQLVFVRNFLEGNRK